MKWLAGMIGLLCFASCGDSIRQPDPPDDLIGRDSMVVILSDLVVLESYIQTRYQNVNNYYKVMTASGKQCLKRFHVTPDRFERSYNYYVSRQEELQGIYSQVCDSLNMKVNAMGVNVPQQRDTIRVAPM